MHIKRKHSKSGKRIVQIITQALKYFKETASFMHTISYCMFPQVLNKVIVFKSSKGITRITK